MIPFQTLGKIGSTRAIKSKPPTEPEIHEDECPHTKIQRIGLRKRCLYCGKTFVPDQPND